MKPAFVVFEGVDGAGKTTQAAALLNWLTTKGVTSIGVHDPGTTKVGLALRALLKDANLPMSTAVQTLLFTAARRATAEHVQASLDEGVSVVGDRWLLSTMAYQGLEHSGVACLIKTLHQHWVGVDPHVTFLLDIDPAAARSRASRRDPAAASSDRFETQGLYFQGKLREAYLRLAGEDDSVIVLDADCAAEDLAAKVQSHYEPWLPANHL